MIILLLQKHRRGFQPNDSGVFYGHAVRRTGQAPKIDSAHETNLGCHVLVRGGIYTPTPPEGGAAALPQEGPHAPPPRGDLVSLPSRLRRFWKGRSLAFRTTPQYGYTSLQFWRYRILVFRAFVCGFDRLQISLAAPFFLNFQIICRDPTWVRPPALGAAIPSVAPWRDYVVMLSRRVT